MATTMRMASVTAFGQPLPFPEWTMPKPGPGQVLVKTVEVGVCRPDLYPDIHDWPLEPILHFISGHEGTDRAAPLDVFVTRVKESDRVGVPWRDAACGHVKHCLQAWETLCGEAREFSVGTP